jgi:hypothetical protein
VLTPSRLAISRPTVAALLALAAASPDVISAQAELQGRVLADSGRRAIANAEVAIPRLELRTRSDSSGRYRLQNVPPGEHVVVTRAVGYRQKSAVTTFDDDETLVSDMLLEASLTSLDEVHVVAEHTPLMRGRLAGFEDRKAAGIGHFLDRGALEKEQDHRLGDVLSGKVPGLAIRRGGGSRAWATTGRGNTNAPCGLCRVSKADVLDKYDIASGAPLACYMDVYLDGALVYSTGAGQTPLFNLNSVSARNLEGIEIYTSASQIPTQYVRTGNGCGVMLIWTRASR